MNQYVFQNLKIRSEREVSSGRAHALLFACRLWLRWGYSGRVESPWQLQQRPYGPQREKYLCSGHVQKKLASLWPIPEKAVSDTEYQRSINQHWPSSSHAISRVTVEPFEAAEDVGEMGSMALYVATSCETYERLKFYQTYISRVRRHTVYDLDDLTVCEKDTY